jgi:hypothetical protein
MFQVNNPQRESTIYFDTPVSTISVTDIRDYVTGTKKYLSHRKCTQTTIRGPNNLHYFGEPHQGLTYMYDQFHALRGISAQSIKAFFSHNDRFVFCKRQVGLEEFMEKYHYGLPVPITWSIINALAKMYGSSRGYWASHDVVDYVLFFASHVVHYINSHDPVTRCELGALYGVYQEELQVKSLERPDYWRFLSDDVVIIATIDAKEKGRVVEVKNRLSGYQGIGVREKIQMMVYMWITNTTSAIHREYYLGVNRDTTVEWDSDFFEVYVRNPILKTL